MTETLVTPVQDALVTAIEISAPMERVFRALIDPAQLNIWFNNPGCPIKDWEMDARPGGSYRYSTEPGSVSVNGVTQIECRGEILAIDPPHLLVYTWIANWHEDKQRKTTVRWELEARGPVTRVTVTHSGLAAEATARNDYRGGWPGVLENLKKFSEK
jgi:uncharacterized protein YndB with AHSA1/START domain